MKRKTTEQFIEEAKAKYGDKYDYSEIVYLNNKTKVKIKCNVCGNVFWQSPHQHLKGDGGCKICMAKKNAVNLGKYYNPSSKEQFIKKATIVHNGFYDYSLVDYVNEKKKIAIICPIHGVFWQTPSAHLADQDCPECAKMKNAKNRTKTTEQFIEEAIEAHGLKYDYTKTIYAYATKKLCIICPIHGEFWQRAADHIRGVGCPYCDESHGEKALRLYFIEHNIKFLPEYTFDDCRGKTRKLPFDYYLPDYNLVIEYQGKQHYSLTDFSGHMSKEEMEANLKEQRHYDWTKRDYCRKHGINYLAIPYWELNNLKQLLDSYFSASDD